MHARRIGLAIAASTLVVGGLQVVMEAPAAAVPGRQIVPSLPRSDGVAFALCPAASPRIVGGGIAIDDGGRRQAFATLMQPVRNLNGTGLDAYTVRAAAPPGFIGTFTVQAFAVCASNAGVPGHQVVQSDLTSPSTASAQDTIIGCPAGKRVIGFGGGVFGGGRQVGLQVVRSTGPRDASRAYAREHVNGYSGQWQVRAYAVCMTTSDNRPPVGAAIPGDTATTLCSTNPATFVHGAGGGAWDGNGLIHRIVPTATQNTVVITPGSTATLTSTVCIP
jgi:hypothetical protein